MVNLDLLSISRSFLDFMADSSAFRDNPEVKMTISNYLEKCDLLDAKEISGGRLERGRTGLNLTIWIVKDIEMIWTFPMSKIHQAFPAKSRQGFLSSYFREDTWPFGRYEHQSPEKQKSLESIFKSQKLGFKLSKENNRKETQHQRPRSLKMTKRKSIYRRSYRPCN